MKILVTNLVEFDEVAERKRLVGNFAGEERDALVKALDAFVAQDFVACDKTLVDMPSTLRVMMHPVVVDTRRAMRHRDARAAVHDPNAAATMAPELRQTADIKGQPLGADGLEYPKFAFAAAAAPVARARRRPGA